MVLSSLKYGCKVCKMAKDQPSRRMLPATLVLNRCSLQALRSLYLGFKFSIRPPHKTSSKMQFQTTELLTHAYGIEFSQVWKCLKHVKYVKWQRTNPHGGCCLHKFDKDRLWY